VHLKSLTLKGFKSFPDRTRLDFGPGVSVVVGPNGSGKSNLTDAVLWVMGEQSALAIRGQSMQDVIFGGGHGVQARSSAEVELVLDNSDGTVELPFGEISIMRRLDRSGDGEYRLNGARCRLGDVIEVLSDTGLGKETHSVISQGRVEAIVTSKPRDRRLLIEEAAGLGKHRKRRRRAQLKLERTQENLDRALDIEREARTRLRPLKRQAEAAELHERLERQLLEARLQLAREALRARRVELGAAQDSVQAARAARAEVESALRAVSQRRGEAERALAERAERHDALARRAFQARAACERLELRREQAAAVVESLADRGDRAQRELHALNEALGGDRGRSEIGGTAAEGRGQVGQRVAGEERIGALEERLAELELERERELQSELTELEGEREQTTARTIELEQELAAARQAREQADAGAEQARVALREAEREVESARRESAQVGAELAAVNQFLRSHAAPFPALPFAASTDPSAPAGGPGTGAPRALSESLRVQPGYELALAAALGGRLGAVLVSDMASAAALLDRAGPDGATALLADLRSVGEAALQTTGEIAGEAMAGEAGAGSPQAEQPADTTVVADQPVPGAQALIEFVQSPPTPPAVLALAAKLLADAWVVERLEDLPRDFAGVAVTRGGRVWFAAWGEVRQVTEGGAERVLVRRNEREQLIADADAATAVEHAARTAVQRALGNAQAADAARQRVEGSLREAERSHAQAVERERHAAWVIEQRRSAPEQGPLAVRRAQLEGELAAERRQAEHLARERAERLQRIELLRAQNAADTALAPLAERLAAALHSAGEAVAARVAELQDELAHDRVAGGEIAGELRVCAAQEAEIQARLRAEGESVTAAEVSAQRLRDQTAEAELELQTVVQRLGHPAPVAMDREGEGEPAQDGPTVDVQEVGVPAYTQRAESEGETEGSESDRLGEEQIQALTARVERLRRRREQLGPVNPLAQEEYAQALAHVEELEARRADLETALRELRTVIRDTDRQINETFQTTFQAAARNFEELVVDVFPGGSGRLRLVKEELTPRPVLGGQPAPGAPSAQAGEGASDAEAEATAEAEAEAEAEREEEDRSEIGQLGVEIEITPAGKSTKRLSLLSGGEKSMTALAFLFAVFLARPCPFYILDEVEAALDDLNLDRFLALLRRYADRAQFIVITHQKRTMEAADWLYGVSMAGNGVSKVLSRRLPPAERSPEQAPAPNGSTQNESAAAQSGSAPDGSEIGPREPVLTELPRPDMAEVA
jgi:chromosome segregation protein